MAHTKILITVKTYPTLSTKYEELVCTAGFREDGGWIRIYPVQFRQRDYASQYKKYDWVELDLVKNKSDFRPESFRPKSIDSELRIIGHIDTDRNWQTRKDLVLRKVYTNLSALIAEAKDKTICTSLAVFKPSKFVEFKIESVEKEWSKKRQELMQQQNLFESDGKKFQVVRKLPYKFSYTLSDENGKESTMMIEDWEIGQLYWNCLKRNEGDEQKACAQVQEKYFEDFARTKDLYLFLGTTYQNHFRAPNPFIIIGTFHPKDDPQLSLL